MTWNYFIADTPLQRTHRFLLNGVVDLHTVSLNKGLKHIVITQLKKKKLFPNGSYSFRICNMETSLVQTTSFRRHVDEHRLGQRQLPLCSWSHDPRRVWPYSVPLWGCFGQSFHNYNTKFWKCLSISWDWMVVFYVPKIGAVDCLFWFWMLPITISKPFTTWSHNIDIIEQIHQAVTPLLQTTQQHKKFT